MAHCPAPPMISVRIISDFSDVELLQKKEGSLLTDPSEIIIIIGIFGLWFYSIGR